MRKALSAVLLFSLITGLIGCSAGGSSDKSASGGDAAPATTTSAGESKDPVKLRIAWWGGQSRHDYTLKVIEMYEKQHPNVTIEPEYAPFDDYWKKLAPQAVAGGLPDIIQMDISYLSQYASRNQLADLKPFTDNGTLNVADVSENALKGGEVDGKLIAMNLGVNALQTTFDVETMKKNGIDIPSKDWTWDDMGKLGEQAKAKGFQIGGFAYHHEVFFPYYLRTIGQKMYSDDGKTIGYADDQAFIDYFTRYQQWYDKGYILSLDKEAQKKGVAEEDEIVLGHSISGIGWSNQFLAVANLVKDRPLELNPMPGPGTKEGLFLKPSMYFSIAESSKQKEEAAKFISFFINDIEANKLIKGERGVPVSSKVKDALKPILSENEAKIFDYVTWAESNSSPADPPNPIGSVEVEKLLRDLSEKILFKKIPIDQAAAEFRKEANAILARSQK
ncbi:sugar ABC transporter substrate-binding protein [Paenibacillus sp. SSG-1]|uniref:ABC transporter substrate-binding protein YesO n=1 Tax=Paenibacillus cineris TaxID=237530 RepID=A0ABQ4LJN9_9BACL|nr:MULTISPECIES: ABC transporter substrate-binding protein [Paenibacillus]OXL85670.1 sugar ABC transporter substrate-binding protein [Paenibacillus sp. SSG-1]GIO56712.1 putative ABC transporter substrate-binding protein YesO [Paenibacillus cineris]